MKISKKVVKEVDEDIGIKCNACDKDWGEEYVDLRVSWGYESDKDGENWSADICEKCVDKLLVPYVKFEKKKYFE